MSDEKKTAWGKATDANAHQDAKETMPASAGAAAVVASAADRDDGNESDGRRGRNQNVLPDILGKQLRAAYGELLSAPVPDAIAELIKKLETAQPGKPATNKAVDGESDT
jgi:Anti-sigma factor NepR